MDKLDALQLFVRIVECRSFTAAAAALEIPRATATNAINELEARLGTRLLERTTRQVRPTLDGQRFHERCVRVLEDLDDAESSLRPAASSPKGTLRLELHGTHAARIVLPRIDEFQSLYPGIDILVTSGDRLVDLIGEGVDCAIRAGTPRESSLVARRLAVMPQVICASPSYLDRAGVPEDPEDLANHQTVGFFSASGASSYPIQLVSGGKTLTCALGSVISVNDAESYVVCAIRGRGLIQLPRFHVEHDLAEGRLVEVLDSWASPGLPVSVVYPYHRQSSARVRVFIDWISGVYQQRFGSS